MTLSRFSPALAAMLLAACGAPDITVSDAWARATAPGQSAAAAYLTIANQGGADRLLSVSSPAAAGAALHSSSTSGGIARMRPLADGIAIPANATVRLEPTGSHVMLTGVGNPLGPGGQLVLTLRFEQSGSIDIPVRIVEGAADMQGMAH